MYHDIYLLYPFLKNYYEIEKVTVYNDINALHFYVSSGNIGIEYHYDMNNFGKVVHSINSTDLTSQGVSKKPLSDMFTMIFTGNADFNKNRLMSLFANKYIERINEKM